MLETYTEDQIFYLKLDRPKLNNAFNDELIALLTEAFLKVSEDKQIRAVVISGSGKNFCAGGDLNWMKETFDYTAEQNHQDAKKLTQMLKSIYQCPVPVIALIQGACMGGGVGLAACADIVIAEQSASFSLSEVKVGLIPATISPYVVQAIGVRQARRFFVTGERFSADKALQIGLVHELCEDGQLNQACQSIIKNIMLAGPEAIKESKQLIQIVNSLAPSDEDLADVTSSLIAHRRVSEEGQEGLSAFLDKRTPNWINQ